MAKPLRPKKSAKPKMGRPTKYKPDFAAQAERLCLLGATDDEVADFFEVNKVTIYRWKHAHPDFCNALKTGKETLDNRVERSLYQRAIGFKSNSVKIFMPAGAKAPVYAPYVEEHHPDTTAAIFWLKNRRPDDWRDKQDHEHTGKGGGPIQTEEIIDERSLARKIALMLQRASSPVEA